MLVNTNLHPTQKKLKHNDFAMWNIQVTSTSSQKAFNKTVHHPDKINPRENFIDLGVHTIDSCTGSIPQSFMHISSLYHICLGSASLRVSMSATRWDAF